MRCFAAPLQLQPQIAFVRRDDLQLSRLADNREIGLESFGHQRARTALPVFLVHQTGEHNFGLSGPSLGSGKFSQRGQQRGHAAFGIARAPTVQTAMLFPRSKNFRRFAADGVQVRRQQDSLTRLAPRSKPGKQIGAMGKNLLRFHVQSGARGDGGEKIGHALLARARIAWG